MTFSDLITRVSWPEVQAALLWLYPDEKDSLEGYRVVLAQLKRRQPNKSEMRIIVQEMFRPEIDETPYFDVAGRDGTLNRELEDFQHLKDSSDDEYADVEVDYSLSFHPWTSWLGMLIGSETLREFSPSNIVAHCLWEMTFHGFEKHEVQDALAELRERADEIDAMTEAEREKFLVSAAERGR